MSEVAAPAYPAEWESDVVLADGGTAHVRPIRPADGPALVAFHSRLSPETITLRFFSPRPMLSPADVERFTTVDYDSRMAFVMEIDGQFVAIARYDRLAPTDDAEVAFVVQDEHQGRGAGTILLEHLAAAARTRGIMRFVAETLPHNRRMLQVFQNAGFSEQARFQDGVIRVALDIEATGASEAAMLERGRLAAARSIERILRPRSIAVIGASRRSSTIGHELFRNVLAGGFTGAVYPVNPTAGSVAGVKAYPSVTAVPDDVDLAVITVPCEGVLEVVEECGEKHVKGLVIISAGFAETGEAGAELERQVVAAAHGHGMRLIGPNCMGVVNTSPATSMNATFSPVPPLPGRVAFSSQSGALGIALLEEAARLGLGVSSFVSVGNKADVSGNDLIQYWEDDPDTDIVLLHVESFGNPRRFSRVARQVARKKPIVAVKSGRTTSGSRGASSHTAALASPDVAVEALFRQTGVIRVDTLEQLFHVAQVLGHQPLPAGRRVAIVGNAGGPGILAADACEGAGLEVPELSEATQAALRRFLPGGAGLRNPVDMVASASAEDYEQALRIVLADPGVDALIVIFIPPLVTRPDDVAEAVARASSAAGGKPMIANFLALEGFPPALAAGGIPTFRYPEAAAQALAHIAAYADWRRRPEGALPELDGIDIGAARAVVDRALAASPSGAWLGAGDAYALLTAYGIPVARVVAAGSPDEAAAAAEAVGLPVAMKAASSSIVHKTDVGGVRLGLASAAEVRKAYVEMEAALGDALGGVVVQPMVPPGVETIAGVVQDPSFGPLVVFGTGGTAVELLGDRSLRVLPLTDLDAAELVRSTKGSPLLFGYRGAPPTDVEALEQLLLRLGRLADEVPEIAELDLNPVVVSAAGAVAVDTKVRLVPHRSHPERAVRRLR